MTRVQIALHVTAAALMLGAGFAASPPAEAATALAPHRAVYDLKLAKSGGKRPVEAVRGRIPVSYTHLTLPTILRV